MSTLPRPLAENSITVIAEVAGKNDLALLELGSVHRLTGRTLVRSKNGGHRLKIAQLDGAKELVNGELRARSSSELTVVVAALLALEQAARRNRPANILKDTIEFSTRLELRPTDGDNAR